jgi:serpin B
MNRVLTSLRLPSVTLLGALATATGCSSSSPPSIATTHSDVRRDTAPSVPAADSAALVDGNTAFAIDAYKALGARAPAGNVAFSPYSISSALAMAYAGAGGATASEMATAMHYTLPEAQLHPAFDALDLALAARAPAVVLHVANSLWGYEKETFGQPFLDTLAKNYGAPVRLEDFASDAEGSREQINGWVSDGTDQRIPNLLAQGTIGATTRFVLVNAIYFDGEWDSPFDPMATRNASFTRLDGTQEQAPTMTDGNRSASYAQTSAYDAVELPYHGGQMAMDIVAPKAGSFAAFESALTGDGLSAVLGGLQQGVIDLALPTFKVAGDAVDLTPMLQGFGMKQAFDPSKADFTAIARDAKGPLFLQGVVHQAYLLVNEKGTEAAAATGVVGGVSSYDPPVPIHIDRPFFFALRDLPTGAILFTGRVVDPLAM